MNPADDGLFREGALSHFLRTEEGGEPLRISPTWTWVLTWTFGALLLGGLLFATLGKVEVTTRARGVLRPLPGVQMITTQVGGTVAEVLRSSGQGVRPGDLLVRLDSASLQAQLLEAERSLRLLESDFRAFAARMDRQYAEQESTLKARLDSLTRQEASQRDSLAIYERKLRATERLNQESLVASMAVDEAKEALAQAQRQWMSGQQAQAQTQQELAGLRSRREDDLWRREQEVQVARAKRDGLKLSLAQTAITAPREGTLESVLVKVGDGLAAGAPVGRILPRGGPWRVVAFLQERDRAFVKMGDTVRLELDQFPYAEFGTFRGRVVRVADDLATAPEFQEAMGEGSRLEGPAFRVEVDLEPGVMARISQLPLRSSMLLNARFTLRRQRPIAILLEPLRRWLD